MQLSFDDVLIRPRFSMTRSRKDVDFTTSFLGLKLKTPFISSNMDTVTESKMANALGAFGALGALHRFCSIERNVEMFKECNYPVIVSVGVTDGELDRARALSDAGATLFLIDVAHGAAIHVVEFYDNLRMILPKDSKVIVGNFATADSIEEFQNHITCGQLPDAYKIGIGGGCFAAGTRILMGDGSYKNIEEITLSDKVINQYGQPVQVVAVKNSGIKKVLKYKTNTFYKDTLATPDHRHWVGDFSTTKNLKDVCRAKFLDKPTRTGGSKFLWKRLDQTESTTMLLPKNINFELKKDFKIKLVEYYQSRRGMSGFKDVELVIEPDYDLGYIFGTYLGDGSTNITSSRRDGGRKNTSATTNWYFGLHEDEIASKLSTALKKIFNVEVKIVKNHNTITVTCRNNFISRMFSEFSKRENKHLPKKYKCLDKEYLRGIYDGLMDSDGHYAKDSRDCLQCTSTSIIELFMFVSYSVNGYLPSIQKRPPSVGKLKNCRLENCKESYSARTLRRPEYLQTKEYQIVPFSKPEEYDGDVMTYDIEVDCPSHSFIANNVIVHNSMCTTRVVTRCGMSTLESLLDCSRIKIPLIADGGIKNSGDAAVALAAGATMLMMGSLFSGTDETPGDVVVIGLETPMKQYRGSASLSSYKTQGKVSAHRAPEGEERLVHLKGSVTDVLNTLVGGIAGSVSMAGASNLDDFRQFAEFERVSSGTHREGLPHGKY